MFFARFVSVDITWNALGDGWRDDYLLEPLYCIVTLVFIAIWFDRSLLFASCVAGKSIRNPSL